MSVAQGVVRVDAKMFQDALDERGGMRGGLMQRSTRPQIRHRGWRYRSVGGVAIIALFPRGNDAGEVIETEL